MIHKTTKTILRTLALALTICATSRAWADPVLTMSGYVSIDSENPSVAFTGVTLDELMTKYKLSGDMGGAHALPVGAATACIAKLNDGALTVQFQRIDGGVCKCVYVKFTEDTSVSPTQIKAVATAAKYANYTSKFGTDADGFANPKTPVDNDSDGGYGICNLELTPRAYSADTININFTHDSANLTTLVEQGLAAYAVSGILWDNMSGGNGSLATVHKTASDGTYSTVAGASITVSGALGSYRCENLTSENDLRHGYVDDASSVATPQIAITGIPFDNYRLVVYHACEAANTAFGYDTIGGVNYKVANGATIVASGTDTDTWGNSGALNSAEAIAVGVNCLVSPVISGSSLTIVGHWLSGGRTGIAAIQIVEADSTPVTYSASINSNTAWSNVSWADSKTWSNDGDAIATISVANSPILTFDESVTACGIFLESDAGGVTLTGTKPTAGIDYSGIAGEVTYGFLCSDPIYSRAAGLKLTGGAGTSESVVRVTPIGGSVTFEGTPYYLYLNSSGTSTSITFNNATVNIPAPTADDKGLSFGKATAVISGTSTITTPKVYLSDGDASRETSLTVKDSAVVNVTGSSNVDANTASVVFGHWNGPSTFTIQDSAEFNAPYAEVLVGLTGNNHTINVNGGSFNVKGIKLSTNAGGTNALNLNGGELKLGATGIGAYNTSKAMTITVGGNAKITANAAVVSIDKAVTVSDGQTLTVDATNGRVAFSSLTLVGTARLVVVGGSVNLREHTIPGTATVAVQDGGVVKYARDSAGNTYYTIAEALAAINDDDTLEKRITLVGDTDENFEFSSEGFVLDTNGTAYSGTISGVSGIGVSESEGVYTSISNTASTWTNDGGDNRWKNAQNWSTKSIPTSSTTVTFTSGSWAVYTETVGNVGTVAAIVVDGDVALAYNASMGNYTAVQVVGNVTGTGKLILRRAGINGNSSETQINCDLAFENGVTSGTTGTDSYLQSGTFIVNGDVTGTGLLRCYATTTFNGAITLTEDSYACITLESYPNINGAVTLGDKATLYYPTGNHTWGADSTLSGTGRIWCNTVVPSGGLPAKLKSNTWQGVLELQSKTFSSVWYLTDYGHANSTIRFNNVTTYLYTGEHNVKVDVASGGLKINGNYSNNCTWTFPGDLSGSGTITIDIGNGGTPGDKNVCFTGDCSKFTGAVCFGSSAARTRIVFGTTDASYVASSIVVGSNASVNVGSTWTAAGGFVIDGEAAVSNDSGAFSGTIAGTGKLSYYGTPSLPASSDKEFPKNVPTFGASWSGDIEIQAVTLSNKTKIKLPALSAANRKLIIKGIERTGTTSVYLGTGESDSILGTTQLDGNLVVSDGNSSTTFTWNKITGSGNMTLRTDGGSATPITHAITTLDDYSGTIDAKSNKAGKVLNLTIGAVNVPSLDLTVGEPLVRLASDANLTTSVDDIAVTVANAATSHKLYKASNGNLYVKVASVTVDDTTTYYPTLQAAADAAMAAGGETIRFTRIDSEAATSLPGWSYEDGVFTFNEAYNVTTATEYAKLSDAVDAASAGDTIKIMRANSEDAVDTTGKDFIFDENGYAFKGTWTGSGRIVLSAAPSTTIWTSARFVSDGETTWTGTVALDWKNIVSANDLPTQFNKYGISVSTVEIGANGSASGYLNSTPNPNIKVTGFLEVKNGSKDYERTIRYITGSGVLLVTHFYNNNGETTHYKITTLDNWSGVITNTSEKLTITTISGGSGVIHTSAAFKVDPTTIDSSWQGRVVLDYANIVTADTDVGAKINAYGVSGSTVEIGENGSARGYLTADIKPNVKVSGTLKIKNGSSAAENQRTIPYVTGSGNLEFMYHNNGGETTNYAITNLESWDGVLTADSSKIRITNIKSGTGTVQFDRTPQQTPAFDSAWRGTFVMNWTPSYDSTPENTAWVLDNYGVSGSTVVIAQAIEHGYLKDKSSPTAPSIAPAVYLKANLTVDNGYCNAITTFSQLRADEGVEFTTRSSGDGTPYAVTLLKDFAGSFNLLYGSRLTIDTIERNALPSAGDLVVSATAQTGSSTPASFNVASTKIRVGGVDTVVPLAYSTSVAVDESGLYKAIADVNSTTYYATVQDAINASTSGDTVTLLSDTTEDLTVKGGTRLVLNGHTISGTVAPPNTTEYTLSLDEGVYSIANRPVTYYWIANTGNWVTPGNWAVNSVDGAVATRVPTSIDSVVLTSAGTSMISLPAEAVTVSAVTVNAGTCALMGQFTSLSLGTVTAMDGVLYVPTPKSVVPTYTLGQFTKVAVGGTEEAPAYTFSLRPGTIFSVY